VSDRPSIRLINRPVVWLLAFYKYFLSPMIPPACRFQPTCSIYARECFENLPFHRALWLSVRRIGRCHPFHPGGYDPAPSSSTRSNPPQR
jgi:putative membrane protein insertion efficiency factor